MAWTNFDRWGRYVVEGETYPRVTTIIKGAADAGGLLDWYAGCVAEEVQEAARKYRDDKDVERLLFALLRDDLSKAPERKRDSAADYGTVFHALAEGYANQDPHILDLVEPALERLSGIRMYHQAKKSKKFAADPNGIELEKFLASLGTVERESLRSTIDAHKSRVWPDVEAFIDWMDSVKPRFIATECTLFNKTLGYAGTCDGYAEIEGETWIFDYKTSKSVGNDFTYQLAAYRGAEHWAKLDGTIVRPPKAQRAMVVHIRDGKVVPYEMPAGREAFDAFAGMVALYHHRKSIKPKPIQSFGRLQEAAA